eukprot:6635495-Prorocentrum_lima.AAC.2
MAQGPIGPAQLAAPLRQGNGARRWGAEQASPRTRAGLPQIGGTTICGTMPAWQTAVAKLVPAELCASRGPRSLPRPQPTTVLRSRTQRRPADLPCC